MYRRLLREISEAILQANIKLYGSFGVFPKKYSIIILAKARLGGS